MGIQRFLTQIENEAAGATVSASGTKTASSTVFASTPARAGSSTGTVTLSGAFSDTDDATIDILIGAGGATPRTSDPVFVGAGNGTMTGVSATTAVANQTITVTLVDLGTTDAKATLDIFGVKWQCKRAASGGNNLKFTADTSGLTYTATNNRTLTAIEEGAERFVGQAWDFGAYALTAKGELNSSTPRIAFGDDPQVYRQYRATESGQTVYYFDPPFVRAVDKNAIVKTVTGTYSVTVTADAPARTNSTAYSVGQWIVDSSKVFECTTAGTSDSSPPTFDVSAIGATTADATVTWTYVFSADAETHSTLTTLYDLFKKLLQSLFVEPADDAVIVEDKTPGGMAVEDMPLRTTSFAAGISGEGTKYVTPGFAFDTLDVSAATSTEIVEIECNDNTIVGAETWDVDGTASGSLSEATTNKLYSDSGVSFTIPRKLPTGTAVEADTGPAITASSFDADDGTATDFPQASIKAFRYGVSLTNKSFTFVYRVRPPESGGLENVLVSGTGPLEACLGVEIEDTPLALTDTAYQYRQARLNEWYADKIESNTEITETKAATAIYDVELARLAYNAYRETLQKLFTETTAVTDDGLSAWAATTAYSLNDEILADTDKVFRATTAGTSGASEPTWVTTDYGSTTTDSTVTWTYIRKAPLALWDTYLTATETLIDVLDSLNDTPALAWKVSTTYSLGAMVTPTTLNGYVYRVIQVTGNLVSGSTDAATEPTWPTVVGNTVVDNDLTWICDAQWTGDDLSGPEATNASVLAALGKSYDLNEFKRRFDAQMAEVELAAGLAPGKSEASGASIGSSPCWSDHPEDSHYWEVNGGEYLPMFTNVDWHSSKLVYDQATGENVITTTQEIYLAIAIGDDGSLVAGDSFTVTVADVVQNRTYAVGDKILLSIVAADPDYLQDGASGDNTHTWGVSGSILESAADYAVIDGAEAAYSDSGLAFTITRGDAENAIGDAWTFQVAREQYQWRKNGGAYSAAADIPTSPAVITDGLSATFTEGSGTSFEATDLFSFSVKQPYSPGHSILPTWEEWQPATATEDITYDFGSDKTVDAIAIPWHTLPSGAGITLELLDSVDAVLYTSTPAWGRGVIFDVPSSAQTGVRKLKISLTGASSGGLAWVWVGAAGTVSVDAEQCRIGRIRAMARSTSDTPGATHLGRGYQGELVWSLATQTTGGLANADLTYLDSVFEQLKANNDQPFCLIPNADYSEAYLFRWADDDFNPADLWEYGNADQTVREHGVTVRLGPVFV